MKTIKYVVSATSFMVLFALLVSFTIHRTERIRGNGNIKTENRTAGNFTDISTSGVYRVVVQQGSSNSIKVEAEENLLPYIKTEVSHGELEITTGDNVNLNPTKDMVVYVTLQDVKKLTASGASSFKGVGTLKSKNLTLSFSGAAHADLDLNIGELEVGLSGASKVMLKGKCNKGEYMISGAANADALDLQTEQAEVGVSGSGEASVQVDKKLNANASGTGRVKYKGEPSITQSVSGMGRVRKL
ncbi:head GIN domain-containing protein [Chitinophaga sp. HK235]|uniref:head GIN domain-containing protein n=1 Tax=Chitinophaga sp. HK235 TaxID=2952571 RepID=UPI001BAA29F7|nr:head GIN domain-containing protein [Chitinophaga sp. HK235]